MNTRRILLASGLVISGLVAVFGDRSSPREVVAATRVDTPRPAPALHDAVRSPEQKDPRADATSAVIAIIDRSELAKTEASSVSADSLLFAVRSWTPPPRPAATPERPSAPPLPFSYLGKEFDGSQWHVFLARQNAVLIVKADDVIEDTYRIESISPPIMTVLYIPLNESQQLSIQ